MEAALEGEVLHKESKKGKLKQKRSIYQAVKCLEELEDVEHAVRICNCAKV